MPAPTILPVSRIPSQDLARAAQGGAEAAHDLPRAGGALAQGVAEQLQVGRLRPGRPLRRPRRRVLRLRLEVEEHRGDVDAGDAVDERVVALADDREAVAVEALDQPQLPERLRAVELLGEDPRGEVAQLLLGARRRQRGLAHVVVEVEVGVVDPDRAALLEGHLAQLLAEAGDEVQARLDVVAELAVGGSGALEDDRRGDVHVGPRPLHVEERGVESGQSILTHGLDVRTPPARRRIGVEIGLPEPFAPSRPAAASVTPLTLAPGIGPYGAAFRSNHSTAESPRERGGSGGPKRRATQVGARHRGESDGDPSVATRRHRCPAIASPSANPAGGTESELSRRCVSSCPRCWPQR